jgi:hypothetical protein
MCFWSCSVLPKSGLVPSSFATTAEAFSAALTGTPLSVNAFIEAS